MTRLRKKSGLAAERAGLAGDIEGFPAGYDTMVGERGLTLSGGQKQRTAIARALLRDPKILVLDDALASVDTLTEERILSGLAEVMRGRTVVLISHRVSTVRQADEIVVLEKGRKLWSGGGMRSWSARAGIMRLWRSGRCWRRRGALKRGAEARLPATPARE